MTELSGALTSSGPMEPTRNPEVTLPDLITVLLDKGTYLNLDLIIAVADIPLIGINLRATIAGMETMLEYGMMRDWDEKTRAWVQQSVARHFPLQDGEEVIAKMAGGHFQQGFSDTWRPGSIFVTNQRLVAYRRDPKEVLWESTLDDITALSLFDEQTIGSEVRTRFLVNTNSGDATTLSAVAPARICDMIKQQRPEIRLSTSRDDQSEVGTPSKMEEHAWYRETRAQGTLWRGGTLTLDAQRLTWKAPNDVRPAVNLSRAEITGAHTLHMSTSAGRRLALHLVTEHGSLHLALSNAEQWRQLLANKTAQQTVAEKESHVGSR
ncbi:gas vesicle protein [Yaniella halotolerans]|uniref:gas vesicle protein n=1 Tax=Yaniella halotolerans TaxID=225453 RepID=UPI0003B35393|nr:gas vesicle protein [Yaniella halotolerans]